ncbi:MerR family transcriptional regulator [Neobacillus sp. PS3-34]|uniref:MerR family transcriptional regulator n=1 Tax=Neobacillus sp. PS3-34 TaxID=3070678 RepID=UPI0027E0B544|nr:MerR family transcriptional regulator [Neobacillus sp. PS3-34]WML48042.1 MerR family transcriptional regulator [Neobacillus sp. PS3-34]
MNTTDVAKLLGVSSSTVQRWIKQLELPMERNDRGHYSFTREDIVMLKTIQEQVQNGTLLQELAAAKEKKPRTAIIKRQESDPRLEKLLFKVGELDRRLNEKADSVASYQLLQHRREIEELQSVVKQLTERIEKLEEKDENVCHNLEKIPASDTINVVRKSKKKNIISLLLGF